jgi:hypothetical protein
MSQCDRCRNVASVKIKGINLCHVCFEKRRERSNHDKSLPKCLNCNQHTLNGEAYCGKHLQEIHDGNKLTDMIINVRHTTTFGGLKDAIIYLLEKER